MHTRMENIIPKTEGERVERRPHQWHQRGTTAIATVNAPCHSHGHRTSENEKLSLPKTNSRRSSNRSHNTELKKTNGPSIFVHIQPNIDCDCEYDCDYQLGPHKAVAEVSKIGNLYRRGWLLWMMDGRATPLIDRKVVGASACLFLDLSHHNGVHCFNIEWQSNRQKVGRTCGNFK